MSSSPVVVVAVMTSQTAEKPTKRYLREVTPASFPVVCLTEGSALSPRDRSKIEQAKYAVVLSPDTALVPGWIDELLWASTHYPDHVVVPGSPNVLGPQRFILEENQSVAQRAGQTVYANEHRKAFSHIVEQIQFATDLVAMAPGPWVAQAFEAPPCTSFDAFAALYANHPLLLAQGAASFSSMVKQRLIPGAPTTRPLVSLCMIVKDEEKYLPDALHSAEGLADEVIVYDTGSKDNTVEIAKAHGAKVVLGEWRDDFAWARNQTLEYATGQWILWIDADERVRGDKNALRLRLEDPFAPYESYSIRIENATGAGLTTMEHFANRIFRRKDCYWRGAIHETVWYRDDRRTNYAIRAPELYLEHLGYLNASLAERNKADRNINVSDQNQSADSPEEVALHRARSLTMAGRFDEAIELIETQVLDGNSPAMHRLSFLMLGVWYRVVGRYDDARAILAQYSDVDLDPAFAEAEYAQLAFVEEDYEQALHHANQITHFVADYDGLTVSPDSVVGLKARALAQLGRYEEASHTTLAGLARGLLEVHLGELIDWMDQGDVPVGEFARVLPNSKKTLVLAQLLQIDPVVADRVLVELHCENPTDLAILATASLVAKKLDTERQVSWDSVLAKAGLVHA
ncbi:TPR domain-containing glycosyltransferase [Ferrimicrobium sp.]|uniref:TPR domain-containing glycosyltransferase n=1 Tax=Ferrimicrobium sp. TaxID=2926050 RepID=UPI00260C4669|nr:TPR domain-containing glycosyltransferase [Ferrimicrobium sp.]